MGQVSLSFFPGWGFRAQVIGNLFEQIDRPVAVGWSFGGLEAMGLVINNPERYQALILIASSPCFSEKPSWPGITSDQKCNFLTMLSGSYNEFSNYYIRLVGHPNARDVRTHFMSSCELIKAQIDELFTLDLRAPFSSIKVPILVIHGTLDAVVSFKVAACVKDLNPLVDISVIEGAGHAPFISHRAEVVSVINDFLRQ